MGGDYRTWHLPDGAIIRLGKGRIGEGDRAVAFSPDGQRLAVASGIGVWLYDVATSRELALFTGHTGDVRTVAFSPNGTMLASGSYKIADAVVSIAALHHVPDKDKRHILDQVYSMLKSRGGFYLEDDSFNFTREEMNERIPEIYAQWEKRFGIENWQILKSELAGDDFEFTSFLDDISHMVKKSGLELSTLDPRGVNGVTLLAVKR